MSGSNMFVFAAIWLMNDGGICSHSTRATLTLVCGASTSSLTAPALTRRWTRCSPSGIDWATPPPTTRWIVPRTSYSPICCWCWTARRRSVKTSDVRCCATGVACRRPSSRQESTLLPPTTCDVSSDSMSLTDPRRSSALVPLNACRTTSTLLPPSTSHYTSVVAGWKVVRMVFGQSGLTSCLRDFIFIFFFSGMHHM